MFKWKKKQFRRTIIHPSHGFPKMVVNDDLPGLFNALCQFCESAASSVRAQCCSFATTVGDVSSPSFPLSAVMRYSKDGFTLPCTVLQTVDPSIPDSKFLIKLHCGRIWKLLQNFSIILEIQILPLSLLLCQLFGASWKISLTLTWHS